MFVPLNVAYHVLRRDKSIFEEDLAACRHLLGERLSGARILVLGAAGSIGSSFVKQLCKFPLRALHLVDPNENNLVELIRDLRSAGTALPCEFASFAIGIGSAEFGMFMDHYGKYDFAANFAALKHVRSERDPYSLRRMLLTNALAVDSLLGSLRTKAFFSVSSDKAVRPANFMGATKALMELILVLHSDVTACSSARFANVAFSDGSLPAGFVLRLQKGQPLCGPSDVKRYFISEEEAGQLCLLSAAAAGNCEILFPKLEAAHLAAFPELAERFLELHGKKPRWCSSEEEARELASFRQPSAEWPCFFAPSDTTGEKDVEEFTDPDETADLDRFGHAGVIRRQLGKTAEEVRAVLAQVREWYNNGSLPKEHLAGLLASVIPGFRHRERSRSLDEKM